MLFKVLGPPSASRGASEEVGTGDKKAPWRAPDVAHWVKQPLTPNQIIQEAQSLIPSATLKKQIKVVGQPGLQNPVSKKEDPGTQNGSHQNKQTNKQTTKHIHT